MLVAGELKVIPWQASNHEFLCIQKSGGYLGDDGGGLTFLSLSNGVSALDRFPDFQEALQDYKIDFEKSFVGALNRYIIAFIGFVFFPKRFS